MLDSTQFKNNIARWALFHPHEAQALLHLECRRVSFKSKETQTPNLKTEIQGITYFYHAPDNPLRESEEQFHSLNIKHIDVLYVFGVGLGYFYEAAKGWLRENPSHFLVFLENDLEVIYYLLHTAIGRDLLFDPQVWLTFLDFQDTSLVWITANFPVMKQAFLTLNLYQYTQKQMVEALRSKIDFYTQRNTPILTEYSQYGVHFYRNYYKNILLLPESYQGNRLFGKFKGIPAIICGAGPSLEKQLPLLRKLKEKALLFAGGTAMNALNTAGILPHFGVGIDPNPAQFTRLIMNQAYEVPYFYRGRMNERALKIISGPRLHITGSSGYRIHQYFEEKFRLQERLLSEGFNVVNFSLSIAHALGCHPIIFVGLDLAYTNSMNYCPGIINHPLHERRMHFFTKTSEEELINRTDYQGKPILTLWKWIAESMWFSKFAQENPSIAFYNATEGGLGLSGIINVPLSEIAQRRLYEQFDLSARIHAEIQQASFSSFLTTSTMLQAMKELLQSLERSQACCKEVFLKIEDSQKMIETLKEEVAYRYLLIDFSEGYDRIYQRDFERLKVDKEIMPESEYLEKMKILEQGRYRFLYETAAANIKIVESVLNQQKSSKIQPFPPSCLESSQDQKIIEDTRWETFVPDPEAVVHREYYSENTLKIEQYFLNNALHGPSICYSQEGKILSRHWFEKGLQQGMAWKFFLDGSLASLQRFYDGEWDGLQETFYPNGNVKSQIHYSKGLLHGAIKLFYSTGQLYRELNFIHGKREGFDRILNDSGRLFIEAQFHEDKGVGAARQWYENGNLEKEVIYHPETNDYSIREWTEDGKLRQSCKGVQQDYFDHVSLQTQELTKTLKEMSEHMEAFLPQTIIQGGTPDLFSVLKEELKHLEELNQKMLFETGLDKTNQGESIWKSESRKLELEEEMGKFSQLMSKEMGMLGQKLAETLEKLQLKIKQDQTNDK